MLPESSNRYTRHDKYPSSRLVKSTTINNVSARVSEFIFALCSATAPACPPLQTGERADTALAVPRMLLHRAGVAPVPDQDLVCLFVRRCLRILAPPPPATS